MMGVFQTRDQALREISALMQRYGIGLEDIANAMVPGTEIQKPERNTGQILVQILSYLGGLLMFAGLGLFADMRWADISAFQRVLITLGPGVVALVLALAVLRDGRYGRAETPLLLIATVLQPVGMFVFLKEYYPASEQPALAAGLVFLVMAVQQGTLFVRFRKTVMVLAAVLFGFAGAGALLQWLHADMALCAVVLSFAGLCLVRSISRSPHQVLAPWLYALFGLGMLPGLYALLTPLSLHWFYVVPAAGLASAVVVSSVRDFTVPRPVALFFIVCFYLSFMASVFGRLGVTDGWGLLFIGGAGMVIGYGLRGTIHARVVPVLYFVFGGVVASGAFTLLQATVFDPLLIGVGAGLMYAGVALASRMLLFVATLSLLGYLAYFTDRYFAHVTGWPLAMVILGFALLLLSVWAVRLGQKMTGPD